MKVWVHSDPALSERVDEAEELAIAGELRGVDHVRAWCVWVFWTQAMLAGSVEVSDEGAAVDIAVDVPPEGESDRAQAFRVLAETPVLIARVFGWDGSAPAVDVVQTSAGRETGFLPVVLRAAVSFAARVRWAAAAAWIGTEIAEVWDNDRARQATVTELERADAAVRSLVESHVEREEREGRTLPLDAATKEALSSLSARQASVARGLSPVKRGAGADSESPWWLWPAVAAAGVLVFALK